MTDAKDPPFAPDERVLDVSPRFEPRVGDPYPRRLNYVPGRSLTEGALSMEQRQRDRRFQLLARGLLPGIVRGLETELIDERTIRIRPGMGLTPDGEDVAVHRVMTVRLEDIQAAVPLVDGAAVPEGLIVLSLRPARAITARQDAPEDPCPQDVEAYPYADLVTLDAAQLVWSPAERDVAPLAEPEAEEERVRPLPRPRPIRPGRPELGMRMPRIGPLSGRIVLTPARPLLGRPEPKKTPLTIARNTMAHRLIDRDDAARAAGEQPGWARHGLALAVVEVSAKGEILYLDRFAVARMGGAARDARPSAVLGRDPQLERARFDQFVAHLQDLRAEGAPLAPATRHFRKLPPVGVLPATLIDFQTMRSDFFPQNYVVEAAPIPVDQLESVLTSRASLAPFDLARRDYVQIVVPVPDRHYEPRLLVREEVAPDFQDAVDAATLRLAEATALRDDLEEMEAAVVGLASVADIAPRTARPIPGDLAETRYEDKARAILVKLHDDSDDLPLTEQDFARIDPAQFDRVVTAAEAPGADLSDAIFQGLKPVAEDLSEMIDKANDFIDMSFVRLQADIYRARKHLVGEDDATRLATSPVLANLATTATGIETANRIREFFKEQTRGQPYPTTHLRVQPSDDGGGGAGGASEGIAIVGEATLNIRPMMMMAKVSQPQQPSFSRSITQSFVQRQVIRAPQQMAVIRSTTALGTSPAQVFGNQTAMLKDQLSQARLQANTIAWQGLVYGKASPVRTVTVAERLRPSPAQEAKNAAVATKAEIARGIQGMGINLEGLQIPVSGNQSVLVEKARFDQIVQGISNRNARSIFGDDVVPVDSGYAVLSYDFLLRVTEDRFPRRNANGGTNATNVTIANEVAKAMRAMIAARAGLDLENLGGLILADRLDPDPPDSDEAAFFGAAVDALENAVSMLRIAEARLHAYSSHLDRVRAALVDALDLAETWQGEIERVEADLAEAEHDRTVAEALLEEETARIAAINARRLDVLEKYVDIIAFARPRTVDRFAGSPGMTLYAPLTDPIPACLAGGEDPPEELDEMIETLRQAPVGWFPTLADEIRRIDRARALRDAWERARDRARSWLGIYETRSRAQIVARRLSGKAATGVRIALNRMRANWARYLRARAERPLEELGSLGWKALRDRATKELSIEDLAGAGRAGAALARDGLEEFERIGQVAACFLDTLRTVDARIRLDWAEQLSVHDEPPDLSVITRAPGWTSIPFQDRRLLEHLHRWMFGRIDGKDGEARHAMSEIVRVCLLLASHAPVSEIVEGMVEDDKSLSVGETLQVSVDKGEATIGMIASFEGTGIRGKGVVEDLIGAKALVRITEAPLGHVTVSPETAVKFAQPPRRRVLIRSAYTARWHG